MLRFDAEKVAEELICAVPFDLDAIGIVAKPDGLARALPYKTHRKVFVGFEEPGVADPGGEEHKRSTSHAVARHHGSRLSAEFRGDDRLALLANRPHLCYRLGVLVALDDMVPVVVAGLFGDAIEQVGVLARAGALQLLGLFLEVLDEFVGRGKVTHDRLLLYANHGCPLPRLAYKGNQGMKVDESRPARVRRGGQHAPTCAMLLL